MALESQAYIHRRFDVVSREGLPMPSIVEKIGEKTLSVYRAKPLGFDWDPNLRCLVEEARGSYRVYGDIPPFDDYDNKAAVYIANAQYQDSTGKITNEWTTTRFVPGSGIPRSTEDLDFYVVKDGSSQTTLAEAINNKFANGQGRDHLLSQTAAISRLSAIRPKLLEGGERVSSMPKFTGLSFALMNLEFLKDSKRSGMDIKILTAQIHEGLRRVLSFPAMSGKNAMPFRPAYEALGISPCSINMDRKKAYANRYPAYFYHLEDLGKKLRDLVFAGRLDEDLAREYLAPQAFQGDLKNPPFSYFTRAGELLEKLDPELMNEIDAVVKDGPTICLMNVDMWKTAAERMVSYAKNPQVASSLI